MNMEPRTYEWSFSPQRLHDIWENKQDTVVCRIVKPALRRLCHYNHSAFNIGSKTLEFDGGKKKAPQAFGCWVAAFTSLEETLSFRPNHQADFILASFPGWLERKTQTQHFSCRSWWQKPGMWPSNRRCRASDGSVEPTGAQTGEQYMRNNEEGLTPQDGMKRRRPSVCLPALQKLKCKHSQSLIFHYGPVKHLFIYNTM